MKTSLNSIRLKLHLAMKMNFPLSAKFVAVLPTVAAIVWLLLVWVCGPSAVAGVKLKVGDIVVATDDSVYRIDPETGDTTFITSGLSHPRSVEVDPHGWIVLNIAGSSPNRVERLNPETLEVVTHSGGLISSGNANPDLAINSTGDYYLSHYSPDQILRLNPYKREQSIFQGGLGFQYWNLASRTDGAIFTMAWKTGLARIFQLTGPPSGVGLAVPGLAAQGLAVDEDGSFIAVEKFRVFPPPIQTEANAIVRIDPVSGAKTRIAEFAPELRLWDLALEHDGTILAVLFHSPRELNTLVRVSPITGLVLQEWQIPLLTSVAVVRGETVTLVALEVNQAVQDWRHTVPLIAGKTTLVRAHIQPTNQIGEDVVVYAGLSGWRDGEKPPGSPLKTVNAGGYLRAQYAAAANRGKLEASLNFQLPPEWVQGNVELRVEGFNVRFACSEPAEVGGTESNCAVRVSFRSVATPLVKFVDVTWSESSQITHSPTAFDFVQLYSRLKAIFPIADVVTKYGPDLRIPYGRLVPGCLPAQPETFNIIHSSLRAMREKTMHAGELNAEQYLYYGVMVGCIGDGPIGGQAEGIGGGSRVAAGFLPSDPFAFGRNTHGHELAHLLGREEAVNENRFDRDAATHRVKGCCGELSYHLQPDNVPQLP